MTDHRSQRVRELFDQALELPPDQRAAHLDHACGGDVDVRKEVDELLAALEQGQNLFEPATVGSTDMHAAYPSHVMIGKRIGHYTIRRLIGAGGMGTVFEAMQEHPHRSVALKLMQRGIASNSALRRFEFESQVLGRLRHPNIAQVYEAGTHDDASGSGGAPGGAGVPFFAMEYVPNATSITEYVRAKNLSLNERLAMFATVCDAVHHGHQRAIIHRDLKPSNILVDSTGQPKVIDFGVARATDSDMAITMYQTGAGDAIGTPQYMSPEQCRGDPNDLDIRSDVYSLGVVLYELLCDRAPYDVPHALDAARVIRETIPSRPSAINRLLRGDVETIVLKALEKDRDRRYQSAADLGGDIQRFLKKEPILARPPSLLYQVQTFARRNKVVFAASSASVMVLIVAVIAVSLSLLGANQARDDKTKLAEKAFMFLVGQLGTSVDLADRAGNKDFAVRLIESAEKSLDQGITELPELDLQIRAAIAGAYQSIGKFPLAKAHMKRALQISKDIYGDKHHLTIGFTSRLASICRDMTDHEQAESLFRKTIAMVRRTRTDRDWLPAWSDFADMLHDLGRCDEAEGLLREALATLERTWGGRDDHSTYYMIQLAGVCRDRGNNREAEQLLIEALGYCERNLPQSVTEWSQCMRELARLHLVQERFDLAKSRQRQALEGFRRNPAIGDNNLETLLCMEIGALIDREQGALEQSEQTLADAAERAEKSLRAEPQWWGAHYRTQQAITLMQMGRIDQADDLLRKAYPVLQKRLGDKHHRTQLCINALEELSMIKHDEVEAAHWRGLLRTAGCQ